MFLKREKLEEKRKEKLKLPDRYSEQFLNIKEENELNYQEYTSAEKEAIQRQISDLYQQAYESARKILLEKLHEKNQEVENEQQTVESHYEDNANEQLVMIKKLEKKFENLKTEEIRQRVIIENFGNNYRENKIKRNCFRIFKDFTQESKRIKNFANNYQKKNNEDTLRKVVYGWKSLILKKSIEERFNRNYSHKFEALKSNYQNIIQQLQKQILETEKSIQLVDKTNQDFTFEFQQKLTQAITTLNREVLSIQEQGLNSMKVNKQQQLDNLLNDLKNEYEQNMQGLVKKTFVVKNN